MSEIRTLLAFLKKTFSREPWWAEAWSSIVTIAWAVLAFGSPMDMKDWPSMRVLTELASDERLITIAVILGLGQMAFLLMDWRWARWGMAILMCWFWGTMTVGVAQAVPWAPGVAVHAGWCGINVFSILRLLRYHGV